MRLIGLSKLMDFGARHRDAVPALAALVALIESEEVSDLANLMARFPAMVEHADNIATLNVAEADCRVLLKFNDRLRIAQVIAIIARDHDNAVG